MMESQLVMHQEDFDRVLAIIQKLVRDANAKGVFVVDRNGQLIGNASNDNTATHENAADTVASFKPTVVGATPPTLTSLSLSSAANYNPFPWFSNRLVLGLDNQNRKITDFTGIDQTGNAPWGSTRAVGYIDIGIRPIHNWTVDYSGTIDTDVNAAAAGEAGFGAGRNERNVAYVTVGTGIGGGILIDGEPADFGGRGGGRGGAGAGAGGPTETTQKVVFEEMVAEDGTTLRTYQERSAKIAAGEADPIEIEGGRIGREVL